MFKRDPDKSFILNYAPIFTQLNFFEKNLIIQKSKLVEYAKGDIIYKQRDLPDAFYCVVSGRVRIFTTVGERQKTLEYLSCGKYFGIISLLTGEPHSVGAEASNDSKILKVTKEDFQIILKRIPKLAVDLSKTLSRRLRRKDVVEKRVFESNIVSIFSAMGGIGRTLYATHLSISLKKETGKNVILIDVSESTKHPQINLDTGFFPDDTVKKIIYQDTSGTIDILSARYKSSDKTYTRKLNALLTYLTDNYSYIIVDLPALSETDIFEVLSQSDLIHILTDYEVGNLEKTKVLISDLFIKVKYPQEKIKVIINLRKNGRFLSYEEPTRLLNYKIYATLPVLSETDEYPKAIRRIARELGDVRVGLALSSGAALGLVHIGVIKVLEKENIPIDVVAGSSIGAFMGALWASGLTSKEMEEIALEYNNNKKKVFRLLIDPCFPKLSFLKGNRVRAFLEAHLNNKTFQDIKFPFKVVAYNVNRRQEFIFDSGRLVDAVMASIAIPGIFAPTKINGDLLVDGGVVESVPIGVLVRMGIKKIIAVNVLPSPESIALNYENNLRRREEEKKQAKACGFLSRAYYNLARRMQNMFSPNIFDIIVNSMHTMEYVMAESECQKADVLISPQAIDMDWFEFFKAEPVIKKGEEAAISSLTAIRNLIKE